MRLAELIKQLFTQPSADVIAVRELEQARRELLAAQNAQEFYLSQAQYNEARIARLTKYVGAV